ncbi:MAG TPA: 2-hydroxyacid dehydrogenase [Candidatus Gemmiger faecigallinarum]|nr:2-hydroxyacid dehydrogenase [Candidatus Gemmiger faecigallinarum]
MKITFYGTREYDHYYFDVLAADPDYGCEIRFLAANLDADTAPLARGSEAVCAFVNSDCSAPVLEALAQNGVRLLLMRCAGFNNVDLPAADRLGITVLRVPGYSPEAVAEHAMALAQAANRRICKAYVKVRNNNFSLDGLLGYNLYGSAAGIVGTGRIGAAMARICHGYGMTVLACDQYKNPALEGIVRYVELEELLRGSDLISLHCPLTADTRHLINADTIGMIRDSAILVNTSRGALIDTGALIDALRRGKFAGVGLDVYEDEDGQVFEDFSNEVLQNEVVPVLTSFPNVVVTSHQAFFTRTALQSIAITTMENARAFARGEKLVNQVRAG